MSEKLERDELSSVSESFAIFGDFVDGAPYGSGHINDTYALNYNQSGTLVRYILQRINHNVFKQPELLQRNIEKVTHHLAHKLSQHPESSRRRLTLIPTFDGDSFSQDSNGNYWRMYLFIEGATTYDQIKNTDQAYQAARAFGQFVNDLSNIPERLEETIPDFHNTPPPASKYCRRRSRPEQGGRQPRSLPTVAAFGIWGLRCHLLCAILCWQLPLRKYYMGIGDGHCRNNQHNIAFQGIRQDRSRRCEIGIRL